MMTVLLVHYDVHHCNNPWVSPWPLFENHCARETTGHPSYCVLVARKLWVQNLGTARGSLLGLLSLDSDMEDCHYVHWRVRRNW